MELCRPYVYNKTDVRPSCTYHAKLSGFTLNHVNMNSFGKPVVGSSAHLNLCLRRHVSITAISPVRSNHWYSSFFGGKGNKSREPKVAAASGESGVNGSGWVEMVNASGESGVDGSGWVKMVKDARLSLVDAICSGDAQQLLDAHPYLKNVTFGASCALTATTLAWLVVLILLRRSPKYSMQGPNELLRGTMLWMPVLYLKSFWVALEDPVRYLINFMAFLQIAMMVAPTAVTQYISPAWRGAIAVSYVWFVHQCKTNLCTSALVFKAIRKMGGTKHDLLIWDKTTSVGLFVFGLMLLVVHYGVAVRPILTVGGGIGGVATIIAFSYILRTVLGGWLHLQISKPFGVGDRIKAGFAEGQVLEIGLTTTILLRGDKFLIRVPNSQFYGQVIVRTSWACCCPIVTKIHLQTDDFGKIFLISEEIESMLRSNSIVFLEKEPPYCFMSRIGRSSVELYMGYNLKHMSEDKLYSTESDILLQFVHIIEQHGVTCYIG